MSSTYGQSFSLHVYLKVIPLEVTKTQARDNALMHLPPGGCALDDLVSARILKVKIQEVVAEAGVGHIAFGLGLDV